MFVSHAPAAIRAICRRVCVLEQGELAFDGDVEGGLAFYDRLLAHKVEPGDSGSPGASPTAAVDDESAGLLGISRFGRRLRRGRRLGVRVPSSRGSRAAPLRARRGRRKRGRGRPLAAFSR